MHVDGCAVSYEAPGDAAPDPQLADLLAPEEERSPLGKSTIIVVAHPDDEVVSVGSRIPRLRDGIIVHVTDGAPKNAEDAKAHGFNNVQEYSTARRRELACAMKIAGVGLDHLRELMCPDQEASLRMAELSRRLAALFSEAKAMRVITHPYEGGHPDHDAIAFAVHAAVELLRRKSENAITILEASSYHMGPKGIEVGCFLPSPPSRVFTVVLTPAQRHLKRQMIDCFVSQRASLSYFSTDEECYRVAPRYDFTRPPHTGMLFYEKFNWGMTSGEFVELAARTMGELGIRDRFE